MHDVGEPVERSGCAELNDAAFASRYQTGIVYGVDGESKVAGPPTQEVFPILRATLRQRFLAALLNMAVTALPAVATGFVVGLVTNFEWGILIGAATHLIAVIVNSGVLVVRTGQSLGARKFAIQLVDSERGTPPNPGQIALRGAILFPPFGHSWHPFALLPSLSVLISPWPLIVLAFMARHVQLCGVHDRWSQTVFIDASNGLRPKR